MLFNSIQSFNFRLVTGHVSIPVHTSFYRGLSLPGS